MYNTQMSNKILYLNLRRSTHEIYFEKFELSFYKLIFDLLFYKTHLCNTLNRGHLLQESPFLKFEFSVIF